MTDPSPRWVIETGEGAAHTLTRPRVPVRNWTELGWDLSLSHRSPTWPEDRQTIPDSARPSRLHHPCAGDAKDLV
jgi:hypothetical protein